MSAEPISSSWLDRAACRGLPTAWWFADERSVEHGLALRICHRCAVRPACLVDAQRTERELRDVLGVRGGLSASQRRSLV